MKKLLAIVLALVLVISLVACNTEEDTSDTTEEVVKVALLLNGTLGDKSFFDSADRGLAMAEAEFGDDIEVMTVEMSNDDTKWMPTLYDYCDDGTWDVIIVGTWQMVEPVQEVAALYPDQKFFLFDSAATYDDGANSNVYSILFKQNEVSFLAGALAAEMSETGIIGFLGGMEGPVINDFLLGYIQGAKYVNDDIKVVISFIGNFYDSAKGKDLALAQYQQNGVDIGFNVAGSGGLGQIDAAVEVGKFAIGVDSDQALLLGEPAASFIPTSAMKNVDNTIFSAIEMVMDGTITYGISEAFGLNEGGVGIADNDKYKELVSQEIRDSIAALESDIIDGTIVVDTAFGKTTEEIQAIRDTVK